MLRGCNYNSLKLATEFENTLRSLIIDLIGDSDTSPYKVSEERIAKWKEKRDVEIKKYKGVLNERRLIYYSDFYDLKSIIDKNWPVFLSVFTDKKRFEVFFAEVEKFRNTIAHGRVLTLSQEYLLKGITSDLKNLITIYHNKNEMKEDFFVRIIKICDNIGNVWPSKPNPEPILKVGDEYELYVEANDPKDRLIEYQLLTFNGVLIKNQPSNRFNFKIDNSLVGHKISLIIQVSTPYSEYENQEGFVINATVLPK